MSQPLIEKILTFQFAKKLGFPTKLAFDSYLSENPDLQEKIDDEYAPILDKTATKIKRDLTADFQQKSHSVKLFVSKWVQPPRKISTKTVVSDDDTIDIDMYPEISEIAEKLNQECKKHGLVAKISYEIATV